MREEVVAHLDGMSGEHAEAVDRAAQAMWKADGGDERMGWERPRYAFPNAVAPVGFRSVEGVRDKIHPSRHPSEPIPGRSPGHTANRRQIHGNCWWRVCTPTGGG
jgi:hypothetical protein